jgi:hypothetical protein
LKCSDQDYEALNQEVVVTTNPQAVPVELSALAVPATPDAGFVTLYLRYTDSAGNFLSHRPFSLRPNATCLTASGEVISDAIDSTDNDDEGYSSVTVYPTTALAREDGKAGPVKYKVQTAQDLRPVEIEVEASPSVQDLRTLLHP